MLFGEVDFLDRFEAAARAGFRGVEFLFPYAYEAAELQRRLRDHSLGLVLHNLPAGDWSAGERGIGCLPDRVDEFKKGVEQAIAYATALGCTRVNCLAGKTAGGPRPGRRARHADCQPALRGAALQGRRYCAAGRADQHARRAWVLPQRHAADDRHHRRRRLRQSVAAVRHLPHANHGRGCRTGDRASPAAHQAHAAGRCARTARARHRRDRLSALC